MNEPETKTSSHMSKKSRPIVRSVNVVWTLSNEKRKDRTGYESSPRDECDDGMLAARRKPGVDEIVVSFGGVLGGQKRGSF